MGILAPKTMSTKKSIAMLEKVSKQDTLWYNKSAKLSLFWIYLDEKEYSKGEKVLSQLPAKIKETTLYQKAKVVSLNKLKKYDKALISGKKLQEVSLKREHKNWSDYFSGAVAEVRALKGLKRKKEAKARAKEFMTVTVPQDDLKLEWVIKHRKWLKKQ